MARKKAKRPLKSLFPKSKSKKLRGVVGIKLRTGKGLGILKPRKGL